MISVIIPIYNVEKYLRQCLESVMCQTYREFEVILVNDGTKDNSIDIVNEFINRYDNIRLINKQNGGLGSARNVGIESAKGEYIVFIDSDDYIEETYLEKLYKSISTLNCDIVICNLNKYYENINKIEQTNMEVEYNKIYSNVEAIGLLFTNKIFCYAWNRIYKIDLFKRNNIKFPEGKLYEDILSAVNLIGESHKIAIIKDNLYNYRIREGTITSQKNIKSIIDYNYAIEMVNNYIDNKKYKKELENEKINFNISYTLSSLDMLSIYTKYNKKDFYKNYKMLFNTNYMNYKIKEVISNSSVNKWVKRDYILFKLRILPLKNKIRDFVTKL